MVVIHYNFVVVETIKNTWPMDETDKISLPMVVSHHNFVVVETIKNI
jgi:hypothetical protein